MRADAFRFSALLAAMLASGAVSAMDMRISGHEIVLSGSIVDGDEFKFKELVERSGNGLRVVRLNSGGGKINPAGEIGRIIRKRGMATLVDARNSRCGSACTIIFGSGVSRHYVGAEGIADSLTKPAAYRGLAFHEGNNPLSRASNRYSGPATAALIGWYYEFGISSARSLAIQAPPNGFYQISGATALSMGIATNLNRP